jgi:hypothetical protein
LPDLLTKHGCVVPSERELRIRGVSPERPQRFAAILIREQKDVSFFALHEGEYVNVL